MTNFEYYNTRKEAEHAYYKMVHDIGWENNKLSVVDWLYEEHMVHEDSEPKFKAGDVIMQKGDNGYTYNVRGYDKKSRSYNCFKLGDMSQYLWEYCNGDATISIYSIPIDMEWKFMKIGYINLNGNKEK